MRTLHYSAKVVAGNACQRGKSEIVLNISKDMVAGEVQLPGNLSIGIDDIADFHHVELKRGWQSPKEILKVLGVSIVAIFIGSKIVEAVDPEIAEKVLQLAATGEDTGPLMEVLEALADASTGEDLRMGFSPGIVLPAYGGIVLSRRKVRFHLTTKDNRYADIVAPEAAAAFIEAIFLAKQHQNGNDKPPVSD